MERRMIVVWYVHTCLHKYSHTHHHLTPVFTQILTLPTVVGDLRVVNGTNGAQASRVTFLDIRRLVAKSLHCHLPQTLGRIVH